MSIYIYIYIYIYLFIYLYISIYIYLYILIKERNVLAFFCKRTKRSRALFRSLQKNLLFFAFFSVLCKRTVRSLRSFLFFRKELKRTEHSFGSHKFPKTREKNRKERNVLFLEQKECNVPNGKEWSAQPWRLSL